MFKKLSEDESVDDGQAKNANSKINSPPRMPFAKKTSHQLPKSSTSASLHHEHSQRTNETTITQRRMDRPIPGDIESRKLVVGRDIHLKGQITSCEKLVVEGSVEAVINDARIIEVSSHGFFKGNAHVMEADISGRFEGELTVEDKLTVRNTGRINGVVRYGRIIIESGGEIAGEMESLGKETSEESGKNLDVEAEIKTKPARISPKRKK